jgi:hypothetical protein
MAGINNLRDGCKTADMAQLPECDAYTPRDWLGLSLVACALGAVAAAIVWQIGGVK